MAPGIWLAVILSAAQPASAPIITQTADGRPGDAVNLRIVGTRDEVYRAFCAAGWSAADPITIRSSIRIARSVVRDRPYPSAPVSNLYLFCRVQDMAFECSTSGSARSRHHVRLWQDGSTTDGRPIWYAAATYDARVGRSPATGRITHRISSDVDAERETVGAALTNGGRVAESRLVTQSGPFTAFNGEGDCYFTDGKVREVVLAPSACRRPSE